MKKYLLLLLAALSLALPCRAQQTGYADEVYPVGPRFGRGWDLTNDAVANSLTSGAVAKSLIQSTSVTLTASQVTGMYATPVQIIAAPGSGQSIVVLGALCRYTYVGAFGSGGNIQLQYGNTDHAGGTTPLTKVADTVLQATASSDTQMQQVATTTTVTQNVGLYASCATAFTGGTGSTVTFIVQYVVV